jgi:hypothetical protein
MTTPSLQPMLPGRWYTDPAVFAQPSMSSRGYAAGSVLVPSEHHLAGFHQWVREMAGEAADLISER